MSDYTPSEIVDMIVVYGRCGENARDASRQYAIIYPNRSHPNHITILKLIRRARSGSLIRKRKKKPLDDNNARTLAVLGMVMMDPQIGQRQICRELNLTIGTVNRILQANHFHPYRISLNQALTDVDKLNRLRFCRWALRQIQRDPSFFYYVMFSDESTFKSNGDVNRHNCHYYSQNNPRWVRYVDNQHLWKINVWCGILNGHIIGPYFFQGNVNSASYLNLLVNEFPQLLEDINLETMQRMWLQQDGAPPHYSRIVREFLDRRFPERWIGRGSNVNWPARSPDLTSPDFYLWGYLKGVVYKEIPTTRENMIQRIREACAEIPQAILTSTIVNFSKRLNLCIQENGGTFEHLR